MRTKGSWSNVPGSVCGEIEIEFTSSGYYQPAKLIGPPENCYPEEGEDERQVDSITITIGKTVLKMTHGGSLREVFDALAIQFQPEIDEEELEAPDCE